ncbi:MAG TPA: MFS transporter, partial [Usitatibacter sp.]|nr:MFS transporter [Usitatibacter sp.]
MELPESLRALRSPVFRRYYYGQAVSMIGTWVQSVATMWLAYRITGSTVYTGLVGLLMGAPHLVFSPFAGVIGDRVNRRKLLITVLTLMALQSLALAVLTGLEVITVPLLLALVLVGGICNAFEIPTRQSIFLQMLDNREDLPNAIALNSMLMNGTRLVGPSIGGLLIAAFGETVCFSVNAVSYAAVIWALTTVRVQRRPDRTPTAVLQDLAEGWRYAMGSLPIRRMLFTLAAVSFAISPYTTLMPALVVRIFGEGSELVGIFIGAVGMGAFISAVTLATRKTIRGLARWIPLAAIAAGLGTIGFGISHSIAISSVLMVVTGSGMFMASAACNTILQTIVDDDKRSRVMAYYAMFFVGSAPFGHFAAGWLAAHVGVQLTLIVGGSISLFAGLAFWAQMKSFAAGLRPVYVSRGIIPAS